MNTPQWHVRNIEGDSIQAECTISAFPKVCFKVDKGGTPAKIISDLQRQFDEHCKKVHEGANG
jgi:hypothetical protein